MPAMPHKPSVEIRGQHSVILNRMRNVRGSLRGPERPALEESPVEEYERRLREQGWSATEQLTVWSCAWLVAQAFGVIALAAAVDWPAPQPRWLYALPVAMVLLALVSASAMAVVALRNQLSLPRRWFIAAFLPWGLHVIQATAALPFLW